MGCEILPVNERDRASTLVYPRLCAATSWNGHLALQKLDRCMPAIQRFCGQNCWVTVLCVISKEALLWSMKKRSRQVSLPPH